MMVAYEEWVSSIFMTIMKEIIRTLARVINMCTIFDPRIIVHAKCYLYRGMRELETGKSGIRALQ